MCMSKSYLSGLMREKILLSTNNHHVTKHAGKKCPTPKKNIKCICALYLGETNFKYQFTGFAILGYLAAIYILYMYLKRINKKICEYMLWNL